MCLGIRLRSGAVTSFSWDTMGPDGQGAEEFDASEQPKWSALMGLQL